MNIKVCLIRFINNCLNISNIYLFNCCHYVVNKDINLYFRFTNYNIHIFITNAYNLTFNSFSVFYEYVGSTTHTIAPLCGLQKNFSSTECVCVKNRIFSCALLQFYGTFYSRRNARKFQLLSERVENSQKNNQFYGKIFKKS